MYKPSLVISPAGISIAYFAGVPLEYEVSLDI